MVNISTEKPLLKPILGQEVLLNVKLGDQRSVDWLKQQRTQLEGLISERGMLLVRGLKTMTSRQFGAALTAIFGEPLLHYQYRSTPRTALKAQVYTASEYHQDLHILQHNESSYSNQWAMRLGFYCQQAATSGGATPVSDSHEVFKAIDAEVREEFVAKKIKYSRNYGSIDLPWQEVFQTEDESVVEAYCEANGLQYEWGEDGLRTTQTNPAVAVHPETQKPLWFNQAHLFHESALPKELREQLTKLYLPEEFPRNCFFGDGSKIPDDMLEHIRAVYATQTVAFEWQQNDLLLLDNMRFTHGRTPFVGDRKVLVGMSRSCQWDQCVYSSNRDAYDQQ